MTIIRSDITRFRHPCKSLYSKWHLDREVDVRGGGALISSLLILILQHHVPAGLDVREHALQLAGELVSALRLELDQHAPLPVIRHLRAAVHA